MIDGIETALESPPTHPLSSILTRRSLQGGHNGPSSVPIFRATPSDGHLTPHPSLVLFDCSMARAAIRSSDHPRSRGLLLVRFSRDSPLVKRSSPLEPSSGTLEHFCSDSRLFKELERDPPGASLQGYSSFYKILSVVAHMTV